MIDLQRRPFAYKDGEPVYLDPGAPTWLRPNGIPNVMRFDGRPVSPQDLTQEEEGFEEMAYDNRPYTMTRAEKRALKNPTRKTSQMSVVHVNDRAPNYRYRGILKIKKCHNCQAEAGKYDEWSSRCHRCGWSEIEALDFSDFELRKFVDFLRANPGKTTLQAYDWIQSQRNPEDRVTLNDEEHEAEREALADAEIEEALEEIVEGLGDAVDDWTGAGVCDAD